MTDGFEILRAAMADVSPEDVDAERLIASLAAEVRRFIDGQRLPVTETLARLRVMLSGVNGLVAVFCLQATLARLERDMADTPGSRLITTACRRVAEELADFAAQKEGNS